MKYYLDEEKSVLEALKTDEKGLSSAEAAERLARNGANKLTDPPRVSMFSRFIKQLADPMIMILLAAALISGITSFYAGESYADVFIILFVVVLNSILGVIQESKAEKAIEALKEMTKSTCRVRRDGEVKIIKSEELVVGDIILLEAGDAVPADARLIEAVSLKAEEAALTGESVPVTKTSEVLSSSGEDIPLGQLDRIRKRNRRRYRNRHEHRNGQNRRRFEPGEGRENAAAAETGAVKQNLNISRARHLRVHLWFRRPQSGQL